MSNPADVNFERSLYVGCALTHAPQEFKDEIDELKRVLREDHGLNVLDFIGLENGTALDVYEWDMLQCVAKCSAFLGVYDHPATGLGKEAGKAVERGIPVLGVAHEQSRVSRLDIGEFRKYGLPFVRYEEMLREVPTLVVKQFVEIAKVL